MLGNHLDLFDAQVVLEWMIATGLLKTLQAYEAAYFPASLVCSAASEHILVKWCSLVTGSVPKRLFAWRLNLEVAYW